MSDASGGVFLPLPGLFPVTDAGAADLIFPLAGFADGYAPEFIPLQWLPLPLLAFGRRIERTWADRTECHSRSHATDEVTPGEQAVEDERHDLTWGVIHGVFPAARPEPMRRISAMPRNEAERVVRPASGVRRAA
ncbi:MAG: hypothetical protein U0075_08520 [Thermomicrobiales bacterium]